MRNRRWATRVAAIALVLGGLIGAGATPAAADPPGGTLRGVYYDYSFCNNYGFEGAQTDLWDWYYCEYRQFGPPGGGGSGYYFLWTFTY